MGQSYAKRGFSEGTTNKVVNFNFTKDEISFDRLKKLREDAELKEDSDYFPIKELAVILHACIKRVETFCQKNDIKIYLMYVKKFHRQSNVIALADAEFVINNFNFIKKLPIP